MEDNDLEIVRYFVVNDLFEGVGWFIIIKWLVIVEDLLRYFWGVKKLKFNINNRIVRE